MESNEFQNLNNKDGFSIAYTLAGTQASTAANYGYIFTARHPMEVLWISVVYNDSALASTGLLIQRARGLGTLNLFEDMLVTPFDIGSAGNLLYIKQANDLTAAAVLAENDSIRIWLGDDPNGTKQLSITLYCRYANRGSYY